MIIGFTLIPVPGSMDIRGWNEMHPLNGPAWSLFFEYIANILYALILRKLSNKVLAVLVFIAGAALIHMAVTSPHGDIIGGWSINQEQLRIGFTRLMYPFLAGLLLSRVVKPGYLKNAFLWCTLLLVAILAMPRIGGYDHLWMNGLYDSLTVIVLFPLVVYMGASGRIKGKRMARVNKFLGDISYPLYITHYPVVYTYMAWVSRNNLSLGETWPVAVGVFVFTILLAYASVKLYDLPVRQWLARRFMNRSARQE